MSYDEGNSSLNATSSNAPPQKKTKQVFLYSHLTTWLFFYFVVIGEKLQVFLWNWNLLIPLTLEPLIHINVLMQMTHIWSDQTAFYKWLEYSFKHSATYPLLQKCWRSTVIFCLKHWGHGQ